MNPDSLKRWLSSLPHSEQCQSARKIWQSKRGTRKGFPKKAWACVCGKDEGLEVINTMVTLCFQQAITVHVKNPGTALKAVMAAPADDLVRTSPGDVWEYMYPGSGSAQRWIVMSVSQAKGLVDLQEARPGGVAKSLRACDLHGAHWRKVSEA